MIVIEFMGGEHREGSSEGAIGPVGLEDQTPGEFQDEKKVTIADFLGRRRLPIRMLYRYDFAEEWIHEIVFEKKGEDEGGPLMIDGARACPPEDFGGAFQYMQASAGEIAWGHPGFDPEAFNAQGVDFTPKKPRKRRS